MTGDCPYCGELKHRGVCLPRAQTLLAEAMERIRELEAMQKSPNVWNVGDKGYTHIWDAKAREYREVEVRVSSLIADGFIGIEYDGAVHLRSSTQVRRG